MAEFKVLKSYKDKELDKKLKKNQKVEMTVKRADEVEEILKANGFDGPFLERIKEKK